jgi:outer membrane receptor protein involved in Fe transport
MNKRYFIMIWIIIACNIQLRSQNIYVSFDSTEVPEVSLDEVVVNASRDNSKLKQLPVSVSTINASSIKLNEIDNLNQASGIIPNFFMPEYGSKLTSPVYIRGIGSRINNPSVGMYVDQVPYFEKASFNFDFFDIERIEVLRGPQGTLFGRNSMGG